MEALLQEKGRLQDFISGSCSGKPTQSGSIDKKHHSLGQSSLSVAGGNSPALPLSVTENFRVGHTIDLAQDREDAAAGSTSNSTVTRHLVYGSGELGFLTRPYNARQPDVLLGEDVCRISEYDGLWDTITTNGNPYTTKTSFLYPGSHHALLCQDDTQDTSEQLRLELRTSERIIAALRDQLNVKTEQIENLQGEIDRLNELYASMQQKEQCTKVLEHSHAAVAVALHSAQFDALKSSHEALERRLNQTEEVLLGKDKQIHYLEVQLQEREQELKKLTEGSKAALFDANVARLRLIEQEKEKLSCHARFKAEWRSLEEHHSLQFQQLQENYELTVADIHEQSLHEKENLKQSEDKLAQCNSALRAMRQRLAEFSDANARLQEKVIQLEAFLATSDQAQQLERLRDREAAYKTKLVALTKTCETLKMHADLVNEMRVENIKLRNLLSSVSLRQGTLKIESDS